MEPIIRPAQAGDLAAVLELWTRAGAEPGHTDDLGSLGRLLAHDPGALLVAEEDGTIVGSVVAAWDGWRGTVYRLAVAPASRRQGLGRRLLHAAQARLLAVGAIRLQAIVVRSDPRATGFWRAGDWTEQVDRLRFTRG
ncbi:MAG TPA: GNAT family N-acetyltransferase [Streptosporangiaceae bacterium]|nr:GNAT family N-acetyltransferase [Streptosporangiaceae bacterium]